MLRFWKYACLMGCWAFWVGASAGSAEVSMTSEQLLPDTTQGFFAISNVDSLTEHWNKTQLGHLMADPVMEPFAKDIRRQFEDRWSNVHSRLGLTLDDMRGVPGGDVGIGLVEPAPGKAALAIVIDVTGKLPQAKEMLEKVAKVQLERGAKQSEQKVDGCPDSITQFDLPALEEEKKASQSELRGSAKSEAAKKDKKGAAAVEQEENPLERKAFYCLTGNLLVVTDNFEVMAGILGRAMGKKGNSLAEHKPFQMVHDRCRADYGDKTPQMRWFIHPLGYAEAARAATPQSQRRKGKSVLEVMRNQGVGAVLAIGGFVDFSSEGYELIHRTAVYAPQPYEKAMKMLALPNETDFEPQPWVPRDIATYTTLYFDVLNAFDNFGCLFDELVAQGEEGIWQNDILPSFQDPTGPQLDLREDLIKHLGNRISILTDYQLPITTTSERLLFAVEAKDAKAVASAIAKLMKNDSTIKCHDVNGLVIWEMVEDETGTPEAPEISFGDVPAVTPTNPIKRRKKERELDEEEEDVEQRLLPHAAITIWQDHLLIASHMDFLLKVVDSQKKHEPLRGDVAYLLIDEEIKKFEPKEKCARLFSRTDEEYRTTYELIRQNKMPESEGLMARLLNGLFGDTKKGAVRTQRIDGSQLPDYDMVRKYLGPAGFQATSEKDGWYFKGFTLKKEAE